MDAGRNDPCPCGSGRKHKHCCLDRQRPTAPQRYFTDDDRSGAVRRLLAWANDDDDAAAREFFEPARRQLADAELAALRREQQACLTAWRLFDRPGRLGASACESFLGLRGRQLPDGQAEYLGRMQAARWRPYEVEAVRPGAGFDLRDLWSGERRGVTERTASRTVTRWSILAVRLVEQEPGAWVIEAGVVSFPPAAKQGLLQSLERERQSLAARHPQLDEDGLLRRLALPLHHLWLELAVNPAPPRVVTAEGDELTFCLVVFDVSDAADTRAALTRLPELQADGRRFEWLEPAEGGQRVLGSLAFEGGRLVLETQSEARAARGRALLERELGQAVRFRSLRRKDPQELTRKARERPRARQAEVPPEGAEQVVSQFYEQHYRGWPDTPLPGLDGLTPREAAGRPATRERVRDLLKQFEHASERQRRDGQPAYDFGWMWKELGLRRR